MKPIVGYDKINEAGEFINVKPGIYPAVITDVIDKPENEYLEVYFDIVDGEFKGHFAEMKKAMNKDVSKEIRSYKTGALPFFKAFITAVEKSNAGYQWNWDEKTLKGKFIVAVFGEEEFKNDKGEVKVSCRVQEFRSIPAFKEGKLKVPELKKLKTDPSSVQPVPATETPAIDLTEVNWPF